MTKLARVISLIFIISFFFVFIPPVSAGFGDLIVPIPEDPQLPMTNDQLLTTNAPSVTFGDLLNTQSTPSAENPQIAADEDQTADKTARFKALLAKMEENSQISLEEFRAKSEMLPRDLPYAMDHLTPTPTPSSDQVFLASLSEPISTPVPTPAGANYLPPAANILGAMEQNPPKDNYLIALLGDSMTDTLGKSLPALRNLLQNEYPGKFFSLLNYGQGATDMEKGLARLTNTTNYLGVDYPPLLSYKPDILVVESFAYNHWSGQLYDLDRQWLTIAKIIDTVRTNSPDTKIILAATIAPNKDIFGDGALNWPRNLKEDSTLIIKAYLQNMINFATSEHFPLADAYHPSQGEQGQGITRYINAGDNLHPSGEGAYLYSAKILEAIKANGFIN